MSINARQVLDLVVYPVIDVLGFDSKEKRLDAAFLMMCTIEHESKMGKYIKQIGGGPALGIGQIEPATHQDVYANYIAYRPDMVEKINMVSGTAFRHDKCPDHDVLIYNMRYNAAIMRVIYRRSSLPIAKYGDFDGVWNIYKQSYNSSLGKATREDFHRHYMDTFSSMGLSAL